MIPPEAMIHLQLALMPYPSPFDIEPDVIPLDGLHEHPLQVTVPVELLVIVVGTGVVIVVGAGVLVVVTVGAVVAAGVVVVVTGRVSSADVAISRALSVLEYSRKSSIRLCFHFGLHSLV